MAHIMTDKILNLPDERARRQEISRNFWDGDLQQALSNADATAADVKRLYTDTFDKHPWMRFNLFELVCKNRNTYVDDDPEGEYRDDIELYESLHTYKTPHADVSPIQSNEYSQTNIFEELWFTANLNAVDRDASPAAFEELYSNAYRRISSRRTTILASVLERRWR